MTTKRIVVGAHYGMRDWLAQRVSAVLLAIYTLVLLVSLLLTPQLTYGTWAGLFASSWMKVLTLMAILSLTHRSTRGWGWGLANGIVTLVLGVLILSMSPAGLLSVIGILVGISFLFSGFDLFAFSSRFHRPVE